MSSEVEAHVTRKYEIKKRLGKGVSLLMAVRVCMYIVCFITTNNPLYINIIVRVLVVICIVSYNILTQLKMRGIDCKLESNFKL